MPQTFRSFRSLYRYLPRLYLVRVAVSLLMARVMALHLALDSQPQPTVNAQLGQLKSARYQSLLLPGRAGQILSRASTTTCRTKTRFADASSITRRTCWTTPRNWA